MKLGKISSADILVKYLILRMKKGISSYVTMDNFLSLLSNLNKRYEAKFFKSIFTPLFERQFIYCCDFFVGNCLNNFACNYCCENKKKITYKMLCAFAPIK